MRLLATAGLTAAAARLASRLPQALHDYRSTVTLHRMKISMVSSPKSAGDEANPTSTTSTARDWKRP